MALKTQKVIGNIGLQILYISEQLSLIFMWYKSFSDSFDSWVIVFDGIGSGWDGVNFPHSISPTDVLCIDS